MVGSAPSALDRHHAIGLASQMRRFEIIFKPTDELELELVEATLSRPVGKVLDEEQPLLVRVTIRNKGDRGVTGGDVDFGASLAVRPLDEKGQWIDVGELPRVPLRPKGLQPEQTIEALLIGPATKAAVHGVRVVMFLPNGPRTEITQRVGEIRF